LGTAPPCRSRHLRTAPPPR